MTLESKRFIRFIPFVVFPLFIYFGLIGTINAFNDDQVFFQFFMILWMAVVLYNIYKFIKMVIKIDLYQNDEIVLKTITGKEYKMYAIDFISIKSKNNMIEFVTKYGKFVSLGSFDGFSEFIVFLKKSNSNIITKGC